MGPGLVSPAPETNRGEARRNRTDPAVRPDPGPVGNGRFARFGTPAWNAGRRQPHRRRPAGPFAKEIMTKKMLIDATHAEETRVVVVDGNKVEEFDFESLNKRQLAGNIYLAKVTRVEPSLQAAFVDYGGNRHGFLAFSEIHPDYYQIPKADREALLAEEAALAREAEEEADARAGEAGARPLAQPQARAAGRRGRTRRRGRGRRRAGDRDPPAGGATASTTCRRPPPPPATSTSTCRTSPTRTTASDAEERLRGGRRRRRRTRSARRASRRQRRYKIQEVIKVRQILLVQVVKEERGNKGAALTTYLSLAGRYCVLMPNTARGGGISRKITNAADRKKLKEISGSITVPDGAGLIIRTAGASRTKTEIKRDYEYLLRQWEQIRDLTLKSIAPAPIYEEGSLIKRAIRDLYSRDMDEILVDGERGYREAKDYMKMLMPSHAKNVKHYADPLPLFSRFQVESYLSAMFNPVVQLKSGGYIVIDVTEALVAIDVNSGRATREASIEETALKTNLEAAEEAARQMRLRDLAGLIVIDFIDMEDRRNNAAVEKRLKDRLKSDRARIQVGRISPFGLLEMSRQRLRPGMIEATTKACPHCHGTGRVRSDDSMALALLREIEEEGVRQRSKEVLIVAPVEIANYLLNQKREHVAMIEARFGLSVRVEGDAGADQPGLPGRALQDRLADHPDARVPEPAHRRLPRGGDRGGGVVEEDEEAADGRHGREAAAAASASAAAAAAAASPARAEPAPRTTPPRERRRHGRGRRRARGGERGRRACRVPEAVPRTSRAAAEQPREGRSRRRSRARTAESAPEAAAEPVDASPFGEVIDLGEEPVSEIVEVPEADAPQRRPRERVRKPVTAVLAEATSIVEAPAARAGEPRRTRRPAEPTPASRRARPSRRRGRRSRAEAPRLVVAGDRRILTPRRRRRHTPTMSPFMPPSAPSSSLCSCSGTSNWSSAATRSSTSALNSASVMFMPVWVVRMSRPV